MPIYIGNTEITGGKLYIGSTEIDNVQQGTSGVFKRSVSISFLNFPGMTDLVLEGKPGASVSGTNSRTLTYSAGSGAAFQTATSVSGTYTGFSLSGTYNSTGVSQSSHTVTFSGPSTFPDASISLDYNNLTITQGTKTTVRTVTVNISSLGNVPNSYSCSTLFCGVSWNASSGTNSKSYTRSVFNGASGISMVKHTADCGYYVSGNPTYSGVPSGWTCSGYTCTRSGGITSNQTLSINSQNYHNAVSSYGSPSVGTPTATCHSTHMQNTYSFSGTNVDPRYSRIVANCTEAVCVLPGHSDQRLNAGVGGVGLSGTSNVNLDCSKDFTEGTCTVPSGTTVTYVAHNGWGPADSSGNSCTRTC